VRPTTALLVTFAPALAGALVALAFDAAGRRRGAVGFAAAGAAVTGLAGMWASFALPVAMVWRVVRIGGPFSAVPGIVALLAALVLLGGWDEFAVRPGGGAASGLIALGAVASGLIAAAADLTVLLVALETAAVCAYALVADARRGSADEASMKYFVQGAVATGALVLGLAVLVGAFSPSGSYVALTAALRSPVWVSAAAAGCVLVMAALAFKLGAAPFHSWAPDAYQSARPEVSAFLSAGPKYGAIAGLAVFMVVATSGALSRELVPAVAVLAVLSVLVGSLLAFRQRSYTRMLGYAGVAQAGYALIGIAVLRPQIALFFGATYAIATTGAFLAAAAFRRSRADWDGSIAGLAGLGRRVPVVSGSLAVLLVSLAGIPPLLGFWGKFEVFVGAGLAAGQGLAPGGDAGLGWTYAVLAVVGVIGSVISLGYYGGVLRSMYLDAAPDDESSASAPGSAGAGVVVLALVALVLGVLPLFAGVGLLAAPFVGR